MTGVDYHTFWKVSIVPLKVLKRLIEQYLNFDILLHEKHIKPHIMFYNSYLY